MAVVGREREENLCFFSVDYNLRVYYRVAAVVVVVFSRKGTCDDENSSMYQVCF